MTPQPREVSERCPSCGAQNWSHLFDSRGYAIGRCSRCGLVRTLGVVEDGVVAYPPFEQRETLLVRSLRFGVAQLLRERARFVESVVPSDKSGTARRLLDIGCGSGSFARLASSRGFDAVGVEPFSLNREVNAPRLRLVRGAVEDLASELGTFDVITMWHVLEHLSDPKPVLARLTKMLRPGGVAVISVPNFESWQSRAFEGGWFHLDPPRHINHFTETTLRALLDEAGLDVFDERTFHFEYGPVGWLQSALNRMLPRKNFLFEFIKDRGALADVPDYQVALNLGASAVLGAVLAAPVTALEVVAGTVGRGSVITVAVRPRAEGRS